MPDEYAPEFLELLNSVVATRPRRVIAHILAHGSVTTEELQAMGYDHPPRAAADVRDHGIPLVTTRVRSTDGRMIGAYAFGDPATATPGMSGRVAISKRFRRLLIADSGPICAVCRKEFEETFLQPDHRIPVRVAGDQPDHVRLVDAYMLLCRSDNRAKSWACEHCPNFVNRDPSVCGSCFWAHPEGYEHVATVQERRASVVWSGPEIPEFLAIEDAARSQGTDVPSLIKEMLRRDL